MIKGLNATILMRRSLVIPDTNKAGAYATALVVIRRSLQPMCDFAQSLEEAANSDRVPPIPISLTVKLTSPMKPVVYYRDLCVSGRPLRGRPRPVPGFFSFAPSMRPVSKTGPRLLTDTDWVFSHFSVSEAPSRSVATTPAV